MYIAVAALIALGLLIFALRHTTFSEKFSVQREASVCARSVGDDNEKVNCWEEIALNFMRQGDIPGAYRAFDYLYEAYPDFGAWGCHTNAHRLGDTAYYEFFVTHGLQLSQMDFPQETTSCGYGFFHGFIEHLIQDHPQTDYVIKTCEYLRGRLSADMHDIARICYHASGHGFIQAVADTLKKSDWGNVPAIVSGPLTKCESLPGISNIEVEECREGVFNVMADWMVQKNFNLSFDAQHPFKDCDKLPARWHWACYYEFGQNLATVINDKPLVAAQFVRTIPEKDIREMTFGVIIAGMLQRLAPLNEYPSLYSDCTKVTDDELFSVCIRSATNGMMEHGDPGQEYAKILTICAVPELVPRGGTEICYKTLGLRLSRFYSPEKKTQICGMFPEVYQKSCNEAP